MKLLFVNLSALKFTVATPDKEPLGGSESCLAYLARQLASHRHDIHLIANLPEGSPASLMGVQHYKLDTLKQPDFFARNRFDVIVACNAAAICPILKMLSPGSILILWDHVPPEQPAVSDLQRSDVLSSIDSIVYVSEWQKRETEARFKFIKRCCVIGNGLTPAFENMFTSSQEIIAVKRNRAAYTTIPYRGLEILLQVMKTLPGDTQLDLFSSMRVYQMADDDYAPIYEEAALNPRIVSYGSVSQQALAQHLKQNAFLAYPCICAETFCIGALEALAAGMKVITTSLGALPSTTMGYADLVNVTSADAEDLVRDFQNAIIRNIEYYLNNPREWAEQRFEQVQNINGLCSWPVRGKAWEQQLQTLILQGN